MEQCVLAQLELPGELVVKHLVADSQIKIQFTASFCLIRLLYTLCSTAVFGPEFII
jgi:hypothetical protein